MNCFLRCLSGLALVGAAVFVPLAQAGSRVVAYVPNWIDVATFAEAIDYAKITHLNVAFENPINDEGDLSFSPKDAVLIAKAKEHQTKILVSIGGGSASSDKPLLKRYFALIADGPRAGFVAKLTAYVEAHGFDGLDVDLEGPSINEDYGKFIADLATALRPKGKLLTCALSKGYGGSKVPDAALAQFDFVNIMAYDGAGPWDPKSPGQHSSMQFARDNVDYWIKRGLAKDRAVLGVPFYGYGFGDAFKNRDYPYNKILAEFPGAETKDEVGQTVWYNGLPTIRAKSRYVMEQGLGGVMIWSLDYDVKGEKSLLAAIHEELNKASVRESSK
jgi:chitinase